jgi:hypothetical protein
MNLLATLDTYVSNQIYRYVFAECLKQIVPTKIDNVGNFVWKKDGNIYRAVGPTVIWMDGRQAWCPNGQFHRDGDQPAFIDENGGQSWWQNGQLHRDGDQPAHISSDGRQEWYQHGQRHRDGDKPAIIRPNGEKAWWVHGREIRWEWESPYP